MKYNGILEQTIRFLERNQLCEVGLWQKFVEQYRTMPDSEDGLWRCEYWGKMMRGACMVLQYTQNDSIYHIIENTVRDMLTAQDELGRFSTYKPEHEFFGWDMWGRKYILLGFQYFMEICRDEGLKQQILSALSRHAGYIIEYIGPGEGQIPICETSNYWGGMNSCSILEPMMRMYELTGEQKYLDFSEYIISTGFYLNDDLIELAYRDEKAPYEYPVTKAYEMMSCFEGLLRYYYVSGVEKHKTAILNFGKKIIETELSIIGCCGCTHELFDHTVVHQTKTVQNSGGHGWDGIMQETCVGVTWMKFAASLLQLSDDPIYADCIEQTFYNNYLGSLNTHRCLNVNQKTEVPQVMPFDSYSPLTADIRGKYVGGYCAFPDHTFYGCCACIGAAGAGVIPQIAFGMQNGTLTFNYYENSVFTYQAKQGVITFTVKTDYPLNGCIRITLSMDTSQKFALRLRIPGWCKHAVVSWNEETVSVRNGYTIFDGEWENGDTVTLSLDMPIERILPTEDADNADRFAAYRRGPIVLAADARITDPNKVLDIRCDENGIAESTPVGCPEIPEHLECYELEIKDGSKVRLIDYASAGKTWSTDSICAAWLYRK